MENNNTITATPQPHFVLAHATQHSLSIKWSVASPQDVTIYIVLWRKDSAEIGRSVLFNDTMFNIEGLDSNSVYQVIVQAGGPLGNTSNAFKEFYTRPKEIQGNYYNACHHVMQSLMLIIYICMGMSVINYDPHTIT